MALDDNTVTDQQEDEPKAEKTPEEIARYWLSNIQSAEKKRKAFITRGRQIIKRFRNKRTLTTLGVPLANRRMNVLWSNVQTQKPVLYSMTPKANVSRRNKTKDPVGRTASMVLQNCLQNSLGMEDFDHVMTQVVEDRLLPGSGTAIVEYVPTVAEDKVGWQAAETRYIHWEDIITNTARIWQENWFWGYRVFLTKKQCYDVALANSDGDEAFAQDVWDNITLDHKEGGDNKGLQDDMGPAKAVVWVIWDQTEKQVIQMATGYAKAPLAIMPPPVNFDDFWPCPRPLQSTTTNDSTIPVPDFEQYVDQADEIDLLTQRIGTLSRSLKMRGVYAGDIDALKQLMDSGDADMIPIENMAFLLEKGGLEKAVLWMPIEQIAQCLIWCFEARDKAVEVMYQVTGISDIMRGATEASETATAQQLKAQFGGVRIRESQKDVQRFIRDLLRKKAEIICEHFNQEVIEAMSGVKLLTQQQKQMIGKAQQFMQQYQQAAQQAQQAGQPVPPPPSLPQPTPEMLDAMNEPTWEEVMALLRDEKLRGFVVDVETDSTIEPDQQAQQASAAGFVTAVAEFMTAALPIMQAEPDAVDFLGELMAWTTRQWKAADTIESAVDEFVEKMKKKAANPQPPPPDPKVQAEAIKAEAEIKQTQMEGQMAQADHQMNMQERQAEFQMRMEELRAEFAMFQQEHALNMETKQADAALRREELQHGQEAAEHGHGLKMEAMDAQQKAKLAAAKAKPKEGANA